MVNSTNQPPETLAILYDSRGHILCVTYAPPPYSHEDLSGPPAWDFVQGNDVQVYKAAILSCIESNEPQTIDLDVNHVGRWRCTLWPCKAGKVRIVGIARRWPESVLRLTNRQQEICGLLAQGLSSVQIAKRLELSRVTVDNHRSLISKRLGIAPWSLPAWCGEHKYWLG
jgi:DNA-binding CsgD family transcriptional regulator